MGINIYIYTNEMRLSNAIYSVNKISLSFFFKGRVDPMPCFGSIDNYAKPKTLPCQIELTEQSYVDLYDIPWTRRSETHNISKACISLL